MGRGPVKKQYVHPMSINTPNKHYWVGNLEQFKNRHFEKCRIKLVAEIDCQIQCWCWKVRSGVRTGFKSRPLFQNDAQRGLMIENQGHLFCLFGPKS